MATHVPEQKVAVLNMYNPDELGLSEGDIETVMSQINESLVQNAIDSGKFNAGLTFTVRGAAVVALRMTGNVIDAILLFTP